MELNIKCSACNLIAITIFRMSECIGHKLPFRSSEINKSEFGNGDRTLSFAAMHSMLNNNVEYCMAAAALLSHLTARPTLTLVWIQTDLTMGVQHTLFILVSAVVLA